MLVGGMVAEVKEVEDRGSWENEQVVTAAVPNDSWKREKGLSGR